MDRARFEEIRAKARARIADRDEADALIEAARQALRETEWETYTVDPENVDASVDTITEALLKD